MDSKWCKCRLTRNESGKIRWCIGSEKTWSHKLKILMFLPIVLLIIILIYLLAKHSNPPNFATKSNATEEIVTETLVVKPDIAHLQDDHFLPENIHLNPRFSEKFSKMTNVKNNNKLNGDEVRKNQGEIMLKYLDETTSPCHDFYQYACGKWSEFHPIPEDRSGFDTFELVRENVEYQLQELLEDTSEEISPTPPINFEDIIESTKDKRAKYDLYIPAKNHRPYFEEFLLGKNGKTLIDPVLKAKQLYKSCINEEALRSRGIQPLLDLLREFRYWPMIQDQWDESEFDLVWLLGQLRLYNNDILIGELIAPDIGSDEYVVMIKQSTLGLPRSDYYLEENSTKYVQAYRSFLVDISVILGAEPIKVEGYVEEIIKFETHLAEIISKNDHHGYPYMFYTRLTVNQLQNRIPQIDWFRYFSIIMDKEISKDMIIITYCMEYLKALMKLLEQTGARTITNYLLSRFVTHRINNLDDRFDDAKQKFHDVVFGREKLPPKWRYCVNQVNSHLDTVLGHMFVKKHFNEKSKNDTYVMTRNIQEAFKGILGTSDWLNDNTKRISIGKIDAMRLDIGYPEVILEKDLLAIEYSDVIIHPDYYFENSLGLLQHTFRKEHLRFGSIVNKNLWSTAPTIVNAHYSRFKNQIMLPAAILQPPFYHQHFPRALNYGGIGMAIGHEISHGFDNKGRLFDNIGKVRWWWPKDTTEKFDKKSKCLIDQYNSFLLPHLNLSLDGIMTQAENIADNSGLKQAYKAYVKWLDNNEDLILPNVKATSIQLFFISFAQVWCGNFRPEAIKNKIKTAVHSPGKFRVLGTLRNFPEFSEAFQCEKDTSMNPSVKCMIW